MPYRDELQAALARAEAAERRLEARCALHPTLPSWGTCGRCDAGACEACAMPLPDGTMWCTRCFVRRRDRATRAWVAAALLVAAAVGATGAALALRQSLGTTLAAARPKPSLARARLADFRVEEARARLGKAPCDVDLAVDLAVELRRVRDAAGTVALVEDFEGRCGDTWQLRLYEAGAREALGEYDAAQAAYARLLAEPRDPANLPMILFNRGQLNARLRHLEQASADLSAALPAGGESLGRLINAAGDLGRPCDAVFAARSELAILTEDEAHAVDDLAVRGSCADLAGRGGVTLRGARPAGDGAVNGVALRLVVDEGAPLVTLSSSAAARVGLAASGPVVEVALLGKVVRAQLAIADAVTLGGASAPRVTAAIVDEIAPGVEAVAGRSFLWRFDVAREDGRLMLRPR